MRKKKHRVIIDTNLWISFLIGRELKDLDKLFASDSLILILSKDLLDEFIQVAQRPKFQKYFSSSDLTALLDKIFSKAEFIEVTSSVSICRDENDDFLLSLAKDSSADYLISGDKDLLDIQKFESTRIITISDYLSAIKIY